MKKIKMQLFGSFLLTSDEASLGEEKIHSNKITRLLVYLLIHRDYLLTHSQLIEVFWEDNSKNPENALKNLMYRIRNELKELGDEKFICTVQGAYRWNPEIEVETDYEKFEHSAKKLSLTDDTEEKEKLCREIIDRYRGNVSAKISSESWIIPTVTWYKSMYMDAVKTLCGILESRGEWNEIGILCNKALTIDSLDEDVYCYLIRSLRGQKKYDLAISQYENANKLFYESMGIRYPSKLRRVFQEMLSETGVHMTNIENLLEEIRDSMRPNGAFFCDYQIFRQIYQIETRRLERLGIAEYIMLLTLRRNSKIWKEAVVDRGLVEGMDILEESLRNSLRSGDVASRYSTNQFIILLPTCTYESSVKVMERIKKKFYGSVKKQRLELLYEMSELTTLE